jgi:putative redox protein
MSQTLTAHVGQIGPATAAATARTHTVIVDRPVAKGGEDRGALGGEYVLVGLGGCFLSNLLAAIRGREAPVSQVRVDVTGTIEGGPDHFVGFTMSVSATHDDAALVRKLIAIAARACVVTNTLRKAAPVSIEFEGEALEAMPETAD